MKFVFVDVGELGWSLLLSMHIRWLRENTSHSLAVIALPDRKCLYRGLVDLLLDVSQDFYKKFDLTRQTCLGLQGISNEQLKEYFRPQIPEDYVYPKGFIIGNIEGLEKWPHTVRPYNCSKKLSGKKEILVFPRHRIWGDFAYRNMTKKFYINLIEKLCISFSACNVRTLGVSLGAYNITEITQSNYINDVRDKSDLQDVIDRCQLAVVAIGGTSSLPKISLLQDVPTFIIGHESKRFVETDNWMQTKVGFYKIAKNGYATIDQTDCINKIIDFTRGCI